MFKATAPNGAASADPLIVRFGALGDMVILLSMVRALHERWGRPVDIVSSGSWNRSIVQGQPGVGRVYLIRSRATPYLLSLDQWRLCATLRARGTGPTWNCDGDARTRALLARANVPAAHIVDAGRVGRFADEHEVDRWLRLAAMTPRVYEGQLPSASVASHLRAPPLEISEQWRRDADVWLKEQRLNDKPIVLIQAGNKRTTKWWRPRDRSSNSKYWPEIKWAQAIDELAAIEPDAELILCGVSSEHALNRTIARSVRTSRLRNFTGNLPLPRLLAIQQRALGMISVDTGPAHCAAAVDCPLVVLFGAADPAMYLPRSTYSGVKCVRGFDGGVPSMRAIAVEDVLNAWVSLSRSERSEVSNLSQLQSSWEKIAAGSGLR